MKKIMLVICILISIFIISGCGEISNHGKYQIKIVYNGTGSNALSSAQSLSLVAKGIDDADEIVSKSDWWVNFNLNTNDYQITQYNNGRYYIEGQCTAIVVDEFGNVVSLTSAEQQSISWTCQTPGINLINNTGYFVSFIINGPGVVDFTVTYNNLTASAKVVFGCQGSIFCNNNSTYYDLDNNQVTTDINEADLKVISRNGVQERYLEAPHGISKILNPEIFDPNEGPSQKILGCVLKVPDGLTYATNKELLSNLCSSYIIITNQGNYAKVQYVGQFIVYEVAPNGSTEFEGHF